MILIVRILKVKKEDLMSYETENKISMKKFYDTIAEKYDHIFPLTPIQKKFFDEETTKAFAVGLKLFSEVMLENREHVLFQDFHPAFLQFMKNLKQKNPIIVVAKNGENYYIE